MLGKIWKKAASVVSKYIILVIAVGRVGILTGIKLTFTSQASKQKVAIATATLAKTTKVLF